MRHVGFRNAGGALSNWKHPLGYASTDHVWSENAILLRKPANCAFGNELFALEDAILPRGTAIFNSEIAIYWHEIAIPKTETAIPKTKTAIPNPAIVVAQLAIVISEVVIAILRNVIVISEDGIAIPRRRN